MGMGMGGDGTGSEVGVSPTSEELPTSSTFSKAEGENFSNFVGCSGGRRGTRPTGTVERSWGKAGVFFNRAICISFNSRIS